MTKSVRRASSLVASIVIAGGVLAACGSSTPTTTTTTVLKTQPSSAFWPQVTSGVRFVTATAAARSFAHDLLGMKSPVVTTVSSSSKHATLDVEPGAGGPFTEVKVSRVTGDMTWWVTAASTSSISVTAPTSGGIVTVGMPYSLSGSAVAFEGVVNVAFYSDASPSVVTTTTVMGGGDVMRPFSGSLSVPSAGSSYGVVVFTERSARDGSVVRATAVRVKLMLRA